MNKTKTSYRYIIFNIVIFMFYTYLCFLMVKICIAYFPWNTEQHFLLLKQDVVNTQPWQFAFKVHVITSSFALIAGFTQFFQLFRSRYPQIHRLSGWLYIITILVFALPSGFILALSAAGGTVTQVSFILLSLLWGFSTIFALGAVFKEQWFVHRDWMIRSFALSLSALSLRSWKMVLYELQPYFDWLTPVHIYQLESWLGWVVNLLIAELIIFKLHQKKRKRIIAAS